MKVEMWRDIPDCPPYQVSSEGRVRGIGGRILKPWRAGSKREYLYISLGTHRRAAVHVLVCEAFNGVKPSPEYEVAHYDGDSLNNRPGNLRWVSHQDNVQDQRRHGTLHAPVYHGERHPRARLTAEVVERLRRGPRKYGDVTRVAAQFGVSASTVHRAIRGETWN